jgi:DNA/RNA-binding domain of Phe-tRNA-synthetase-like protein
MLAKGAPPPRINRLVDAYNAVSLRHVLPADGEDLDRLVRVLPARAPRAT